MRWRRIEAKESRETDAAGGGVTCKAVSEAPKLQGRDRMFWQIQGWCQPERFAGNEKGAF